MRRDTKTAKLTQVEIERDKQLLCWLAIIAICASWLERIRSKPDWSLFIIGVSLASCFGAVSATLS